jgi:DNA-binding PadR family transcriptional regulator
MTIKYAILGFLTLEPLSGYDLKKKFQDSLTVHWSGNNNQIYRSLISLHDERLVTREVQQQEHYPARKVYTITESGRNALLRWVLTDPEAPELKNSFLIQLTWADRLHPEELDRLLEKYEDEIETQILITRAPKQQEILSQARSPREKYLWEMILKNRSMRFETELDWIRQLRQELAEKRHN